MPPTVKYQKEEIVQAALNVARKKGMDAVTAREVAKELQVSVGPIFTWFETMEQLKAEVYEAAKAVYLVYIERGLQGENPLLDVGLQSIAFAREEPEIFNLLFLAKPTKANGGAMEAMKITQDLTRESIKSIYRMNDVQADGYFRNLWLVAFSFGTLIVADKCPYTDEQISAIFSEISLSICLAYKEIPGLPEGKYEKEAIFKELINK